MTTWDEAKRQANIRNHRVDLARAEEFEFSSALVEEDRDIGYEQRFRAIGFIDNRLHFLVYTLGAMDEPHAITLRLAEPKERRRYVQSI